MEQIPEEFRKGKSILIELLDVLSVRRDKHSDNILLAEKYKEKFYQTGFRDGIQQAMNIVVGILDDMRLQYENNKRRGN